MTKNEIRKKYIRKNNEIRSLISVQPTGSYMIESRVRKLFKKWLKENLHRFNYKPYAVNSMCEQYHFEGITKDVTLVMDYRLPEAMMYHHESACTHDVIQYIGEEKYDPQKGYYDFDRMDEKYEFFPTQKALYMNDVFEYIITYVNEKFVKENQIYVNRSGCSESSIIAPKADYDKLKENFNVGSFCLDLSCASSDSIKNEPVMHVYDLFEEVE